MTNEEKMQLLKSIFESLFSSKQQNIDITQVSIPSNRGNFPGRWFSDNTLRGFDVDINLGSRVVEIRCVEQNPNKLDNRGNLKWSANLARQGHQIMWVIDRKGGFLGRMQKDLGQEEIVWHAGFESATQPVTNTSNVYNPPEEEARTAYHQINQEWQSAQNPMAQTESLELEELPELPNNIDIPDYILESVANMENPPEPDFDEGER